MRKRTKVRVRRVLYLLAVLTGAVCAWKGGWLIIHNAVHGFDQLPQLAGVLAGAWLMVQVSGWLGDDRGG